MRGANGVRDKLAELLAYETARKLPLLREVWSLDQAHAPDVDQVVSGESADHALTSEGDVWIVVINPRLVRTVRVDIDDAGRPVYMTRYSCRVYIYVKGDTWSGTITARDNVAAACRLALLEYPTLSPDVPGDSGYRLHENTYTEESGEPRRLDRTGRVWCGGVLSIELDCEENLADGSTRPPIGQADTATLTGTEAVGPAEPLTP